MNSNPLSLETLGVRVTVLEQAIAKNSEDHGKIYSRMESIETSHAVVINNMENIIAVCNEIKQDVKDIKEKPAKRWEMVVSEVVRWVAIAALGAVVVFK